MPSEHDKAKLVWRLLLLVVLCTAIVAFVLPVDRVGRWWVESGDVSGVPTALTIVAVVIYSARWLIALVACVLCGVEVWVARLRR